MKPPTLQDRLKGLHQDLQGEVLCDDLHKMLYATDASVYKQHPLAVAFPKNEIDLQKIMQFCVAENIPIIPRGGGTSLAGQVVGQGLVCDTSRHMKHILEIDQRNKTATVQPGVIRDVLNSYLSPKGLFFGPNTSTSNRCNLGGMVGNNSCGTTSIRYGNTRDKLLSLRVVTADGFVSQIGPMKAAFDTHVESPILNNVLRHIQKTYDSPEIRKLIIDAFPHSDIRRRNTGYALDDLCLSRPFHPDGLPFNLARLLCGSEGTLALTSEITLQLDDLPPPHYSMVTLTYDNVHTALADVSSVMSFRPYQCELMDDVILGCTSGQPKYEPIRALIPGQPKAVLMVELRGESPKELEHVLTTFEREMQAIGIALNVTAHSATNSNKLWSLRKAGLGLLANIEGDETAIACIEDTAVRLEDLPAYIDEFESLMSSFGQRAVYYAHAGAGELHLRPILNLKTEHGKEQFKSICTESARLVRKYRGSLSGEHGDGRVRAPFIKDMVGEEVYGLLCQMKEVWDPNHLLNPGKIVNARPIDADLRYIAASQEESFIRFGGDRHLLDMAEMCNGSGDCRKLALDGGTMCPSYHATRHEKDTTRGRANTLREVLLSGNSSSWRDSTELIEVLDLCLSCKGCKRECPSNVDMALMKAEFLHQYYAGKRRPLRDKLFVRIPQFARRARGLMRLGMRAMNGWLSWMKPTIGIASARPLPMVAPRGLNFKGNQYKWAPDKITPETTILMCDEFTDVFDVEIGVKALELLDRLGFQPMLSPQLNSARAEFSKGMLDNARALIDHQIARLDPAIKMGCCILGVEPSAILGIRDEWPKVCTKANQQKAEELSKLSLTIEEFLWAKWQGGVLDVEAFEVLDKHYHVHGHCHFKALSDEEVLYGVMSILPGSVVHKIDSGCCGMAGSFGYEEEHYGVSMNIGEQVLFPYLRKVAPGHVVVAHGTSCRHQIFDFLGITSQHPVEVLHDRLIKEK